MNEFYGGHQYAFGWAVETGTITESSDGVTPPTLPTAPASYTLAGYTNRAQTSRGLNNSKGFSTGTRYAAYNKRGRVQPSLSLVLRSGSLGLLLKSVPDATTGTMPRLCIWVFVPPGAGNVGYTDIYRFCQVASGEISVPESTGAASEMQVTLGIEATCKVRLTTPVDPILTPLNSLGTPLFFSDLRTVGLTDSTGATAQYRNSLSGLTMRWMYGLEGKSQRPHFGDNSPLSRTRIDMLDHTLQLSGEMPLHKKLPEALFTGSANAMDWQGLSFTIANISATKSLAVSIANPFPTDETDGAVDPSAQQTSSVSFLGSSFAFTTIDQGTTTTVNG